MRLEKTSKYGMISLIVILTFLFTLNSVQAIGVTRPVPYDIELMRNESAGFRFQIQAVTSTDKISCSYSMNGLEPLVVTFEKSEVTIDAGSVKNVYGTVAVPADTEFKTYNGKLSVSCGAVTEQEVSGSVVKTTIGDSPLNVKVVEVREKEIEEVIPPKAEVSYLLIIAVIIIVVLVIGVYYWFRKSKKK